MGHHIIWVGFHPKLKKVRGIPKSINLNAWTVELFNPQYNLKSIGGLWVPLTTCLPLNQYEEAIKDDWAYTEEGCLYKELTGESFTAEDYSYIHYKVYPANLIIKDVEHTSKEERYAEYETLRGLETICMELDFEEDVDDYSEIERTGFHVTPQRPISFRDIETCVE